AGAIFGLRPLVVDIYLVAKFGVHLFGILAANENAAIGFVIDPELSLDLKVTIGVLGNQKAIAFVGDGNTIRQFPVAIADDVPIVEICADELNRPSRACLAGGFLCVQEGRKTTEGKRNCNG